MNLKELKQNVFESNQMLPKYGLVTFAWGMDSYNAVHNAVVGEEVTMMAWHTLALPGSTAKPIQKELLDKHYLRKHGVNSYYGQAK